MSTNMLMKFVNLRTLADASVNDLMRSMGALGADQAAITIETDDGHAVGGLVCLHGPDTRRYMDAIQAVRDQIEQEQTNSERSHA
ncbi:hypothetical protein Tgr7_1660 [Thioalkalivibrio sulfidiphilus HL-EbGr7]|uniref:Uncharacterized protein n=1 Tax=Thioalkalivibrio sulfidiphilus (strain HL-EbGR7) TaxID=396588 RepID=B8GS39_THISH|nr:hypothetical protein [Thioalkalivibrio sulfidiphilus]ACL72743.1 hypothetical protein Tgr7_1660 [Thioalkalivibrio sulfidiphilus HL-EbGr7]